MRSAEGFVVLKSFLLIFSDRILDSKVDPGRPSLAAAPDGPDICPPPSRRAASIISFSWAASFLGLAVGCFRSHLKKKVTWHPGGNEARQRLFPPDDARLSEPGRQAANLRRIAPNAPIPVASVYGTIWSSVPSMMSVGTLNFIRQNGRGVSGHKSRQTILAPRLAYSGRKLLENSAEI